jgi:hypothetical protein
MSVMGKGTASDDARRRHPRAYERWSAAEEGQLLDALREGRTDEEIAQLLQRQVSAIRSRRAKIAEKGPLPTTAARPSPSEDPPTEAERSDAAMVAAAEVGEGELATALLDALETTLGHTRLPIIAAHRWGLGGVARTTDEAIGRQLGVTRQRVSQLEKRLYGRVRGRAKNAWTAGRVTDPWFGIVARVRATLRPEEPADLPSRLTDFLQLELGGIPLSVGVRLTDTLCPLGRGLREITDAVYTVVNERAAEAARRDKVEREEQRLYALLVADATWSERGVVTLPWPLRRVRDPRSDGRGINGTFHSGKLGEYVAYESLHELDFFKQLEASSIVVRYREQPFVVPADPESVWSNYHPDVLVQLRDGRSVLVEVKPVNEMAVHDNVLTYAALHRFCLQHGAGWLVTDGRDTLAGLLRTPLPVGFAEAVHSTVARGPLNLESTRRLLGEHGVGRRHLNALILQGGLRWTVRPFFRLVHDPTSPALIRRLNAATSAAPR